MRIGNNPMRKHNAERLPGIVLAVITHLPNLKGYHKDRFEVIQTCLTTMRNNAGMSDVKVYVWDNGSGPELRGWLQDAFCPDFLTLSPNIGKSSARAAILRSFPPETIVGVSDDDMYFYPGWLKPQLELLKKFPNVGVVSGWPVRTQFKWGINSTMEWATNNADELMAGRFISPGEDRDYCTSIGRDYEWHRDVHSAKNLDFVIRWKGLEAYATAHHCQFIGYAGRLANVVEWNEKALPREQIFDNAVDEAGLLRLTTRKRYTRHIGNVLDEEFKASIAGGNIQSLNIGELEYA